VSFLPLEQWLVTFLPGETRGWYQDALAGARRSGVGGAEFATAWSSCGRRLGRAPLALTAADADKLVGTALPFVPVGWGTDEAGRALLLLAATEDARHRMAPETAAAVADLFATGELREQ
jgi:hypothetical protein